MLEQGLSSLTKNLASIFPLIWYYITIFPFYLLAIFLSFEKEKNVKIEYPPQYLVCWIEGNIVSGQLDQSSVVKHAEEFRKKCMIFKQSLNIFILFFDKQLMPLIAQIKKLRS